MVLIIGLFCLLGFHKWPSTTVIFRNLKSHYCSRQEKKYIYIYMRKGPWFKKSSRRKRKKKGGKGRKDFYSHMDRVNAPYVQGAKCWGSFCGTQIKGRKPNPATQTEKKLAKDREQKPLSPSGRNNGSQVYEISKWALRKRMGSKELGKREIVNSKPMGSVWCEKSKNGPH